MWHVCAQNITAQFSSGERGRKSTAEWPSVDARTQAACDLTCPAKCLNRLQENHTRVYLHTMSKATSLPATDESTLSSGRMWEDWVWTVGTRHDVSLRSKLRKLGSRITNKLSAKQFMSNQCMQTQWAKLHLPTDCSTSHAWENCHSKCLHNSSDPTHRR